MKIDRCRTAKLACLLVPVLLPLGAHGAIAQITPANDGTGTRVTGTQQFNITGGTQAGSNLFQSFQQFGLNVGQTANFITNPNTQNILSRVTGGNASLINGLLQVSGSNANLYLINPSGIVFGKNASLNAAGSFTATTANGIGFGNGQWLNAFGSNNYAVLTSNPTSFGFIGSSGSLINAGNLAVNPGQSIALVGGTVVNTGIISAPGGNITIVAVPGEKLVRIGQDGTILSLDLPTTDKTLINAPTITPIALPELLTGGSIPSAMGVVVEDGVIKLKSGSASIAGNLTTNGIGNQTGGNIIAYADNHLNFSGTISAKGGELGGNGGFVDTSGKGSITIAPNVQVITTAAKGLTGNWVIDPANLEVVAGTGGTIVTGTNFPTTASTIGAGTIVTALNTTNVNLQATNSITVNAAIDASANTNSRNLTLIAPIANLNQAIKLKGLSTLSGTATTVNVGPTGTVQNGIDVASTTVTGTVNLAAAIYRQGSPINIAKNVTVRGLGLGSTTISGNNQYRVFTVNSGTVTLDQMSIVAGRGDNGAGINNQGNLIVDNSSINSNKASNSTPGGGIYNTGTLQILRSTIRDNSADNTGGIFNSGVLTIEDSTLSGNTSVNRGAAIINYGPTLTIRRSTLSGNGANSGSGGIENTTNGNVTIENSTITNNTSVNDSASGISGNATLYIKNSIVSGNSGLGGVEIYNQFAFKFNSTGYNIFGQNGINALSTGSTRAATDITPNVPTSSILTSLADYGGSTKTHALIPGSIAINAANPANNTSDQRGITVQGGRRDIGAYESVGFALLSSNTPQSTTVGTAFANPLNVNLIETAFNKPLPVAGITISFTSPGALSPGAVLPPIALTNASGAAQISAVANTKAGTYNVQANSTGITGTTFLLTNTADVANSIVANSGSGQAAVVNNYFENNLAATVTDKFGNPVQNSTVTFSLPSNGTAGIGLGQNTAVTDVNGQVSIAIKANTKAGAFTTTGSVAGVTIGANFDLTNIADIANAIAPTSGSGQIAVVDNNFANNLVVTVTDKFGNPINNSTVTFSVPGSGASGVITSNTATTNVNGIATIAIKANTKAGVFTTTGSIAGVATGANFNLTNIADAATTIVAKTGSGQTAVVDNYFENNLTATVTDKFGNPVNNSTVTFSLPGSGASGIFGQNTAITDVNGVATIAIKANTKAGAFTTTGNVAGVATGANFNLTTIADVANAIFTTSGSGQTATVDRNFTNNLIATVTDKFGNPVNNSTVTFSLSGSGASGIFIQNSAITNANGQASIGIKANTKAGTFTTTGTIANVAKEANFNLTNVADAASTIVATSGSDQTAVVDTNFTNNLVATVSDKFANPVQNQTVILSLPGTGAGAALIQNTAVTDVNGQISIPVKATRKVGSFTTQATIPGIATAANFDLNIIIDNATKAATTQGTQSSTTTVTDKSGNSGGVAAVAGGDTIGSSGTTTTTGGDLNTTSTNSATPTNSTSGEPSKPSTESAAVTPAIETHKSNSAVSVSVPTLMMLDKEVSRDFEGMGSVRNSIATNIDGTFNEIQQKTGAHPAIIYLKTIRRSGNSSSDTLEFTILTSQGQLARTVAIDMTTLDRDIVKFRKEITNPIRTYSTSYLPMAKRLYNALIAPMLPDLKAYGITNLVFIPEAGLRGLPYAALHDGKQFLIEQFSVSIMPSLSLVPTGYRDIRPGSLVSMGISKSTQGQTALPMVETELATIGQLWRNSSTYLNDRATSSLLQNSPNNQEVQILHLATHANFISGNPKEAYIQFWNDRFRLDQLKQLDWNKTGIDLLVLSACKTAVGDDVRSGGNPQRDSELGFAGLALQSGVRTVVASLWSVSDTGTMGLISSFYERLLQSPTKAEALRQAQISMLKGNLKIQDGKLVGFQNGLSVPLPESALGRDTSFRHPYYWSAFTMVGNPW